MYEFQEYLSKQMAEKLASRRVVVFYDPRKEFAPFIDDLPESVSGGVKLDEVDAALIRFSGSFMGVKFAAEPIMAEEKPNPLLIYIPGVERDRAGSVLMELEKAGATYEPQLKRQARNVLRAHYTDGEIDRMLEPDNLTYHDVVQFLEQREGKPSMLKAIFSDTNDNELLALWLSTDDRDLRIEEKQAAGELYGLIESRLGLSLPDDASLSKARQKTAQYVLVGEFRSDLQCAPPTSVGMIADPPSKDHLGRVRTVVQQLRDKYPEQYVLLADQVEKDLNLSAAGIKAEYLGSIDTFRFEEQALLAYCGSLILGQDYGKALKLISDRWRSFWVDRDVKRQSQWEAVNRMAKLGHAIIEIQSAIGSMKDDPALWVKSYAQDGGWHVVDMHHRNLESWIPNMEEDPENQQALGVIRQEYETLIRKMAEGYSKALQAAKWNIPDVLHQTDIYSGFVGTGTGRTAYFMVDALRFEMGVELSKKLQDAAEIALQPAVASLPSITPVGMAALLPDASGSFSVIEHKSKLAARIEDVILGGSQERMKHMKALVPGMIEMTIGKLLGSQSLKKTLGDANLIVVRSQEIDKFGEEGDDWTSRQLMDNLIGNIVRAVKKLAKEGVERFVITADHGYQYSLKKEEDMRTDNPGGDTVECHRRCWAGRGGKTPTSTVRVTGAELGYDTDLDFIFPTGLAVLSTAGGLSYHHGGISLQEMVIPVLSLRYAAMEEKQSTSMQFSLAKLPETVTNRTFVVCLTTSGDLFKDPIPVRVVLISEGKQVGHTGMVMEAKFDQDAGTVTLEPMKEATVVMLLRDDECKSLRVVVTDPGTDAVLAESNDLPVKLGI